MSKVVTGLFAVGLTGLALATAGCGLVEAAARTTEGSATESPSVVESASATVSATSSAAGAGAGDAGCPVTGEVLFAALKETADVYADVSTKITGLSDVECYEGFATALTVVDPNEADPIEVIFRYSATTNTWTALALSSDRICQGLVPADIIPHLTGCSDS